MEWYDEQQDPDFDKQKNTVVLSARRSNSAYGRNY